MEAAVKCFFCSHSHLFQELENKIASAYKTLKCTHVVAMEYTI